MSGPYHERGVLRGLVRPSLRHLKSWLRQPAYRALHDFHRRLRNLPRGVAATVEFQGRPVRLCDGPSFLSAWDEIFVNRIYEIPIVLGKVPTLVDAGANIGLAALFWKWVYGEFNYIGFEPDPVVAACCRANLENWGIRGELIEAAVGVNEGTGMFVADGADGGRLVALGEGRQVATRKLSRLLPEQVDLLKIDVEGAEADVLADVAPSLSRVRTLFMEWHARVGGGGLGAAISTLETAGFDCYVQVASGPTQPFLGTPAGAAYVQNLNLYAVRP